MRVGVLGLGSAGARHARLAAGLGHDVVGFDPADGVAPGVPRAGSEAEAIDAAEAVIVATPNDMHATQAVRALEAGRHVLVEKPLASSVEDAERVVAAAAHAGLVCGVAMNLRFHPGVVTLKQIIDAGRLGTPLLARASFGYDLRRWRPGSDYRAGYSARAALGGGVVLDAIHELDYLAWLLGPISTARGETARLSTLEIDVEDVAVATLRFASGALATVDLNYFEPAYRRGCLVAGELASATWDWNHAAVHIRGPEGTAERIDAECELDQLYEAEVADFLEAVGGGGGVRTPVQDGLAALHVAEALKASSTGETRSGDASERSIGLASRRD